MKVFFLIDSTFSERDFIRFGIDAFIRDNIQVYLWSFSDLRGDTVSELGFEENLYHKQVNYFIFTDFKACLQWVKNHKDT